MAGIILAGGNGERLGGTPKALRKLAGKPLLEWVRERLEPLFPELILVTNTPELYFSFPGRVVTDLNPNRGPLGGIEAGLLAAEEPVNFVTGCDMPFLNQRLIERMKEFTAEYDIVLPRQGPFIEPLHAFYSRKVLVLVQKLIREGNCKLRNLLAAPLKVYYLNEEEIKALDPLGLSFFNVNTPADLERAAEILAKEAGSGESCRYS